jgi:hypothetical protein
MEAKITVQVKHLTCYPTESDAYYDIPNEVFAYANLNKGEVVIFVACDTNNKTFYWRYILLTIYLIKHTIYKHILIYR